jgi:hypothetical protein
MKKAIPVLFLVAGLCAVSQSPAWAGPAGDDSDDTLRLSSLLEPLGEPSPGRTAGFLPVLQDGKRWGWEEDDEPKEEEPKWEDEGEEKPPPKKGRTDEEDEWAKAAAREKAARAKPKRVVYATRTRIGIEGGGFLPFGEKEESYNSGEMAGFFFGFGLGDIISGLTITNELRLIQGYATSSPEDEKYDLTSFFFIVRDDLLFHFFPENRGFNFYYFLGIGMAIELWSSDEDGVRLEEDSGTGLGLLIDTGFGAWVNISGPLDLVLRLEANIVPVTKNVPFFMVGQIGLQIKL